MSAAPPLCPNCGSAGVGAFCPSCGQTGRGRLEGKEIFRDALDHFLNVNGALPRTLRELSVDPGGVARRYVAGHRARYLNPLKYCLMALALFFLLNAWLGVEVVQLRFTLESSGEGEAAARPAEISKAAGLFLETHYNNILFLALPIFAWFLTRLYRRAGFNYAETYAFILFVSGHVYLLSIFLIPLRKVWEGAAGLRLLLHMGFFVYAAVVFYDQKTFRGVVKALAAHLVYVLCVFLVVLLLGVLYVLVALLRSG